MIITTTIIIKIKIIMIIRRILLIIIITIILECNYMKVKKTLLIMIDSNVINLGSYFI